MNNKMTVTIPAVLVVILGIQTYAMFRLNSQLSQLDKKDNYAGIFQIKMQKLPKLSLLKPTGNDDFPHTQMPKAYGETQLQNAKRDIRGAESEIF
ncbi:hypothetical protein [Crenothrix sp.]|uniref:hypothetical protein n=1 Tax=Crenothrix sp. TaxID=3100433 RepID=UPI00374D3FD4